MLSEAFSNGECLTILLSTSHVQLFQLPFLTLGRNLLSVLSASETFLLIDQVPPATTPLPCPLHGRALKKLFYSSFLHIKIDQDRFQQQKLFIPEFSHYSYTRNHINYKVLRNLSLLDKRIYGLKQENRTCPLNTSSQNQKFQKIPQYIVLYSYIINFTTN